MELEMQASIDKGKITMNCDRDVLNFYQGTPSFLFALQYDCDAPHNLNDVDLYPDMTFRPTPHPDHVFTDTSYLHHSVKSLPLRAKLLCVANSLHTLPSLVEMLQAEQDIQNCFDSVPKWNVPSASMARTLLELQLRQFIIIIHTRQILATNSDNRSSSSYRYGATVVLDVCESFIALHTQLIEACNYALCCMRFDYLRAALLICHITYYASIASDTFVTRIARPIFESTKVGALKLMEERSLRPGRGNHHYWYLSAAISLVSIQYAPEQRSYLEEEAGGRVCNLLYRMLALQDDEGDEQPAEVRIYLIFSTLIT
jgi:hypothetical protein